MTGQIDGTSVFHGASPNSISISHNALSSNGNLDKWHISCSQCPQFCASHHRKKTWKGTESVTSLICSICFVPFMTTFQGHLSWCACKKTVPIDTLALFTEQMRKKECPSREHLSDNPVHPCSYHSLNLARFLGMEWGVLVTWCFTVFFYFCFLDGISMFNFCQAFQLVRWFCVWNFISEDLCYWFHSHGL